MMEIDRISYIFGSFARRRQSHESGSVKRRSIEPSSSSKVHHDRSKSTPSTKNVPSTATNPPRPKSVYGVTFQDSKFKCPACRQSFNDPRVLPCLHTFCLSCLERITTHWCDDNGTMDSKLSSGGSGYISDGSQKTIKCPTCSIVSDLPLGGCNSFPPNYIIQHRMVLATMNNHKTHLLCDLCPLEVTATHRCTQCALSLCGECGEIHLRQKLMNDHEVLTLEDARHKGITRIRRQIMCIEHANFELDAFCTVCVQVVCRECISGNHKGHICEPISRAAKLHIKKLRRAVEQAKSVVDESVVTAGRLNATTKRIDTHCTKIQNEVEQFIDNYIKSVQQHREHLLKQIQQAKEIELRDINERKMKLHRRIKDARDVAYFLDDLLSDGMDVEVLSFIKPIFNKLERCKCEDEGGLDNMVDSLQFLTQESVNYDGVEVFGVVTTQSASPQHCSLNTDGFQNLRVGRKVETILEIRDFNNKPLQRGGELITAEIHHRDAGISKSMMSVGVLDRRDGTYLISFIPDVPGKLSLCIYVQNQPIKDSPFPLLVRSLKPHHGTFHCCTFCSSGGSKEAHCGCGGSMPGGYKGCGHGHEGHPGRRHWSCCGNVLEHSECGRSNSHYQFTL